MTKIIRLFVDIEVNEDEENSALLESLLSNFEDSLARENYEIYDQGIEEQED